MQKKAIVSACLLGERCRYDGKTKRNDKLLDALKEYEIIPFCPEAPLFGTPREKIHVMEKEGRRSIVTDESNKDVTAELADEIRSFMQKHPRAERIVLKSKSPSCGLGTTPILDETKRCVATGNGIAAEMFLQHYKTAKISDENEFHSH